MKPQQFYNFISRYIDEFNTLKNNFHKYTDSNGIPHVLESAIRERLNKDLRTHLWSVTAVEFRNIDAQTKLLDVRKLYSYYSFSDFTKEREVIAFGDIPISSYEIQRGVETEPDVF